MKIYTEKGFRIRWHHIVRGVLSLPLCIISTLSLVGVLFCKRLGEFFNGFTVVMDGSNFTYFYKFLEKGSLTWFCFVIWLLFSLLFCLIWLPEIKNYLSIFIKRKNYEKDKI